MVAVKRMVPFDSASTDEASAARDATTCILATCRLARLPLGPSITTCREVSLLIAFAGLPSSGKSSTAKALGEIMDVPVFLEPEESDWPTLVRDRNITGKFTALTWFRGARLPGLFEAKKISEQGGVAIVDSYYDKLVSLYMREKSFSWLVPTNDPYFDVSYHMAVQDFSLLPDADILVMLKLDEKTWQSFMEHRGRDFDRSADLKHHFEMQMHIENACKQIAQVRGTRLVIIDQDWSKAESTAQKVRLCLSEV
jgi:deoxyadenosine/deoxycytidine kinase